MVLLPLTTGFVFPNDFVPESEKLTKEYGACVGRALYSRYCFGGTYPWGLADYQGLKLIRLYGDGDQPQEMYREWYTNGSPIGGGVRGANSQQANSQSPNRQTRLANTGARVALANISYQIYSPLPKHSNTIISTLSENDYRVDCTSVNQEALEERVRTKLSALYRSTLLNPLAEQLGIPKMDLPKINGRMVNIRDEKELEMYERRGLFKSDIERALEQVAETNFALSDWKGDVRPRNNKDSIDYNYRCAKVYTDPESYAVKVRYVDVSNLVMLYNDNNQEPVAIGDIRLVDIQYIYKDLVKAGYTEEQIKAIAQMYQGQQQQSWQNNNTIFQRPDPATNKWIWLDFKVPIMEFEYLSTDHKQFVKGKDKKGNSFYKRNEVPVADKDKTEDREYDDFKCNYWFEGTYVVGTDRVFNWRKKPNQIQRSKLNPMSSYVFDRAIDNGKSLTERAMPLCDDLQMALLKLRAAYAAAAPKGFELDIADAANIKIGGQEYSPFDLIHMWRQNGIRIKASRYNASTGKVMQSAISELENGLGKQGLEWLEQMSHKEYQIANIMGITDAMAAQPDQSPEKAVGLMEGEISATNHAIYPLKESDRRFKVKVAQKLILQTRINIQYDERCRKFYEGQIGKHNVDVLDTIQGITLETLGITLKALPTKKQKDLILMRAVEMSKIATRDGTTYLSPSDVEHVSELLENDDVEGARFFMAEREMFNRAEAERISTQAAQQTGQIQIQSAQAAEQAKQQTLMLEGDLKLKEIAAKGSEERATVELKARLEGPQKLQEISLQTEGDKQLTAMEIAGQMATGADIKNQSAA